MLIEVGKAVPVPVVVVVEDEGRSEVEVVALLPIKLLFSSSRSAMRDCSLVSGKEKAF